MWGGVAALRGDYCKEFVDFLKAQFEDAYRDWDAETKTWYIDGDGLPWVQDRAAWHFDSVERVDDHG